MVAMIDRLSGSVKYVAEERVKEYLAKGDTLVSAPAPEKAESAPKKAPVRKRK